MIHVDVDTGTIGSLGEQYEKALSRMMYLVSMELMGNVKREAPVDQGRLQGSFLIEQTGEYEYTIFSGVEYAEAVDFGTPPHRIEPKHKKCLHFEMDGQEVFCKDVDHPGTAPNPFIERGIERTEARIDEFAERAIGETLGAI